MTIQRFLKVLRVFYQGLRHITAGLKAEIDEIEKELQAEKPTQS